MTLALAQLEDGERGKISEISGGQGLTRKLDNMNLYIGKEIMKITRQSRKGPVIVQVGNSQLALGYGIACKIWIEVIR